MIVSRPYRSAMWCGCHGVPPRRVSIDRRAGEFDDEEHGCGDDDDAQREVREGDEHPSDLRDRHEARVRECCRAVRRILHGDPAPLHDQCDPHHDIAGDHDAVVDAVAAVHRGEERRDAEREHDHADHLHHRRRAVEPVVGVVRRREPREVDPRPACGEHRERERSETDGDVALAHQVSELVGRLAEGDHECEVEQQLERGGCAVRLRGVAPRHAGQPVPEPFPLRVFRLFGHLRPPPPRG